jgi:hypothetical protein
MLDCDWSSDVCSSDLNAAMVAFLGERRLSAGRDSGLDLNAYAASRFSR